MEVKNYLPTLHNTAVLHTSICTVLQNIFIKLFDTGNLDVKNTNVTYRKENSSIRDLYRMETRIQL